MRRRVLIYGASGHGKVVADAARAAGWEIVGFADDDRARAAAGPLGPTLRAAGPEEAIALCRREGARFVVAIGDNAIRRRLYETLAGAGLAAAVVIHPSAVVAESAAIGPGTVVFAGVVVNAEARVGADCILNTACSVDHDNEVGDHVHVSPGVRLGGGVRIGEGTHVGLGASVRNNLTIGSWATIGMGSVVVRDVPAGVTVYGVPARLREKP